MGLWSWIRGQRQKTPPRPWVRPEFYGVIGLFLAAGLALSFWGDDPQDLGAAYGETRREYVGLAPDADLTKLPCEPSCHAQQLLEQWMAEHPDAQIVKVTPVHARGILVGHQIEYRLPA